MYHKPNFTSNPKCCLIDTAKSEIGLLVRNSLRRVNKSGWHLTLLCSVKQWRCYIDLRQDEAIFVLNSHNSI